MHAQSAQTPVDLVVSSLVSPVSPHYGAVARPGQTNRLEDRELHVMEVAFTKTGGLLNGTDVAHRMRRHHDQALGRLARWIVSRSIINFEWRGQILIPMFQFDASDMTIRGAVTETLRELAEVFDDWESAFWFASPHAWLDDRAPVDVILVDPVSVVHAARVDRFVPSA